MLNLARTEKQIQKCLAGTIAFWMALIMLMGIGYPGLAAAGSAGDVIAEVAGRNLKSPKTYAGVEETKKPGGKFSYNTARGGLEKGVVNIAINEALAGTDIQAVIDMYDFGEGARFVFPMQGYEIKQGTNLNFPNDLIAWVELPQYLIVVSMQNTGSGKAADLQKAKSLIQQLIDGLTRNGLLQLPGNQAKSVQNSDQPVTATAAAVTGKPLGESVKVADTMNIAGVYNKPTAPATFSISQPHLVTHIDTYHWNNARGAAPGTIALRGGDGKVYGPWKAGSRPGQGGVPHAYWEVSPNIVIPAGTYTIIDSDPATWSQNQQSGGRGMAEVKATPHFAVTGGVAKDPDGKPGIAGGIIKGESPAGIGPVGNIPGPSNTTEAIVGVVAPGLIATVLGALAGLGGGGGGFAPPGATPLSPAGGGPLTGAGGTAAQGNGPSGVARTISQMGRKRPTEITVDTVGMGQGAAATGQQAAPESGLSVETAAEEAPIRIQAESGATVKTAAEAGIFIQTEQSVQTQAPGADASAAGISIDVSAIAPAAKTAADAPVAEGTAETGVRTAAEGAGQAYQKELAGIYDEKGFDPEGYDRQGFDAAGFDKEGYNKAGFDKAGFNREGFDQADFDKEGFDKEGYGRSGFNAGGFDREGYDVNGYNAKGFNRSGYDAKGYNAAGFDKEGWDAEGYGRDGLNKTGYDRQGYDKDGYDKDGYNREGFDRDGRQRDGSDEYGYGKDGFNENGFDQDGYDREGFNYEGYNRSGYDPWGYDKRGYGKDGYHWSGYNADGYNRSGRHWSENPYDGDGNPFNVLTSNAQRTFGEGKVTPHGVTEISKIEWKPEKPPLGEPYPKTVDKYGAKPWTNETPQAEPEKPEVPKPGDAGVIGPEEPLNTLKQHDLGKDTSAGGKEDVPIPAAEPEGLDKPDVSAEDVPFSEDTPSAESGIPGWPQDGEKRVLVGKTDGRSMEIEYNGKTGEWINTESGGIVDPDKFEQWQEDLAEDRRRVAEDIEKMSQRQDAASRAIDQKLADWKKLEQMQKAADKYNIGETGGPGDVDKAIQKLKDDMLAGKEFDQKQVDKIRRVIDNRILGKTTADTGRRWEEVPWYKDLDAALKANLETAREVTLGEKADGSISWVGMGARMAIGAATGGASEYVMTVAEAMHRINDAVDKGESDFRAVSKAIGKLILEEAAGELIGAAGGKAVQQFADKFPNFTQKAGDLAEKIGLAVSAGDQLASKKLGLISKQSAEEALADIAKKIDDIGADGLRKAFDDKVAKAGLKVAGADDLAKAAGKAAAGGGDDVAVGAAKAVDGPDLPGPKAAGAADDAADAAGKAAPVNTPTHDARSEAEVLNDPKAVAKAEKSLQKKMDDFDKLPEAKKQELIKDQAIYDEYRLQAQEKVWRASDKMQRGEALNIDDILEVKADPAAMRTLKNAEHMEGLGAELGDAGAKNLQSGFNDTLRREVHLPSNRDVETALRNRYGEVRVETVRTPGTECHPWSINTDNDVIALRQVVGPNGPEWVEIPRGEWEDIYFESYARHTGFDPQDAARRFPAENWSDMSPAEQYRRWGELHGENPTDVTHLEAARDFSDQRTWIIDDGDLPGRPMIEATPEEITRGVETVTIDGRQMRPASGAELVQRGQGTLLDSEQLGMMEKYKIDHYWEQGDIASQTEAMEQLRKAGEQVQKLETGYRNMGYKITGMPENMQKGLAVVNDNSLSPASRAARLAELGYDSPGDFVDRLTSRIGALRAAQR